MCHLSLLISHHSIFSLFLKCSLPPLCRSHLNSACLPLLLLLIFAVVKLIHVAYFFVFILCQVSALSSLLVSEST